MKKNKKPMRVIILAIVAVIVVSFIAVQASETKVFKEEKFIAFSKTDYNSVTSTDFTRVTFDELENYQSVYKQYNQYQYYENLNESEKIIYKAFEFALDNSLPVVFIDKKILADSKYSNSDIFNFLTLDSAIAEQNNVFQETTNFPVHFDGETRLGTPIVSLINGNIFNINIFDNKTLKSKEAAIKKAKDIVSALPTGLDDLSKAKMLFTYLHENVEYIDYSEKQEYLYDTLVVGKSNCDGFANAYSLLCKLAGIPCFEKMYSIPDDNQNNILPNIPQVNKDTTDKNNENNTEEPEDAGHTWNAIKIDGKWYNVDATNSDFYFEAADGEKFFLFFGFKDSDGIYKHDYEKITPECNDSLLIPDCTLKSFNDNDAVSKMRKAWYENDEEYIIVYCENADGYDDTMQELANSIRTSIYHENYNDHFSKIYFVSPQ